MRSPRPARLLAATLLLLATCSAGPVGPLPNVTSSDLGLKEGSCALGDVVYLAGDEFPGASACEKCACAAGSVVCRRQHCDPRPGCKALHRPDHCCPIYQCECEQDGRVYGNGEKLVDPADPCRVCYCQGGEVVCRRIACFVRDDCSPRHVPGRCCPEYDNCPLRGVTTVPGVAPSGASTSAQPAPAPAPALLPPKDIGQEITIKEITPVSEIPVITEVKIKEILPVPSIDAADYVSSKSPLIVREATTEKPLANEPAATPNSGTPVIIEVLSSEPVFITPLPSEISSTKSNEKEIELKNNNDSPPSKISLSTQETINSEIKTSILTSVPTMGVPSVIPEVVLVASSTKSPIIEEDESTLFDHNPAFPPLPDDLSVAGNHEDDIVQEQTIIVDGDHTSEPTSSSIRVALNEAVIIEKPVATTIKTILDTTITERTTILETSTTPANIIFDITTINQDTTTNDDKTTIKYSPMLNLRSAIPTEILNVPSFVPEEITGEEEKIDESTTTGQESSSSSSSLPDLSTVDAVTQNYVDLLKTTEKTDILVDTTSQPSSTTFISYTETTTNKPIEMTTYIASTSTFTTKDPLTTIKFKSSSTDSTSQTELSSLPIETSDQNPSEVSENVSKEETVTSTASDLLTTKLSLPTESEVITVSRALPSNNDKQSFENVETTEFILTSFGSSESATDAVELIKISGEPEKSAAIIDPERKKVNLFTDLINLVGDVASIGDRTDRPTTKLPIATSTNIADSEELIPVNAGYKSKNSNWNVNSITELPVKSKSQSPVNKQKVIEIEGEDSEIITDSPAPNDNVEPTTRRPIIDNVSDDLPDNQTEKKDIEIITKSYVPTISRRPTKVVMKKSNEKPAGEHDSEEVVTSTTTESNTDVSRAATNASATSTRMPLSTGGVSSEADTTIGPSSPAPFTQSASTAAPTAASTAAPTAASTAVPAAASTVAPTAASTVAPSAASTTAPTAASTAASTVTFTAAPTSSPRTDPASTSFEQ